MSAISSNRNIQYGSSRLSELSTTNSLGKWRAYSLCGSMISVRNFGRSRQALLDQHRHRGRLADAGRADHREVAGDELVDADRGRQVGVLGQRADLDAVDAAKGVDRLEVVGADAMGDGAERGIGTDAAVEPRRAVVVVDDLAAQLHLDVGDVAVAFVPASVDRRQFADHAHQARLLMDDGDEVADRPMVADLARRQFAGDHPFGAVERHQAADGAVAAVLAPLAQRRDNAVRSAISRVS